MTCPRDGSAMREDTDFLRDAIKEGVEVRRWVCTYGHSAYSPTTPEQRGWTPQPEGPRRCICGVPLPGTGKRAHGVGTRRCRACRGLPATCTACGALMDEGTTRKTCSDACVALVASATGRLALEKQRAQRRSA